jgi:hypothetical protein
LLGLVGAAGDRGFLVHVVPVAVGEQLFTTRARLGHDVLERFHLLGEQPPSFVDHSHPGHGCLDGERAEHAGEERYDDRGADPEKE